MNTEKKCFKCESLKPLTDFYKHAQMKGGRLNKCKECNKKDVRENRVDKLEYYQKYDRDRGSRQTKEYRNEYKNKYPNEYKAHNIVSNAIRGKKLFKQPCEKCGTKDSIHAHHKDYLKPLNITWLCAYHHFQWHKENGEGLNA